VASRNSRVAVAPCARAGRAAQSGVVEREPLRERVAEEILFRGAQLLDEHGEMLASIAAVLTLLAAIIIPALFIGPVEIID
jgi:hypothetical protein